MLVEEIFRIVQRLNREQKLTVLLVDQNATLALGIAEHGYVMENGRIVLEGAGDALRSNADIKEFYLGLTEVGARKSYRDVKHYKRRKRWLSRPSTPSPSTTSSCGEPPHTAMLPR